MSEELVVRPVRPGDADAWLRMREALWPSSPPGEHAQEVADYLAGSRRHAAEVLVAVDQTMGPVGFAELSIRTFAEGCDTDRVAYLEGWYVEPAARRRGVGAALVRAAEVWGRAQGCTEFASDTDLDNAVSQAAHLSLGFEEVGRAVCFRKRL